MAIIKFNNFQKIIMFNLFFIKPNLVFQLQLQVLQVHFRCVFVLCVVA